MTELAITTISVGRVTVPLTRAWSPDITSVTVLPVEIVSGDGIVGHGFSWLPNVGAGAVRALIEEDLVPWWRGRLACPSLWSEAWQHVHLAGAGITTMAMAGIDLALWDAAARRASTDLSGMLGRRHDSLPVFASSLNLHYTVDELVAQAHRWVDAGYSAMKVEVGRPDPLEDLERMRAVREVIGPDRELMIDAAERWDLAAAIRALDLLAEVQPAWVEEPLRGAHLAGYRTLASRYDIAIAAGRSLHTLQRFREAVDAGVSIVRPNVVRVGGVTPFLEIARETHQSGASVSPHTLVELSAQVAFALPGISWIEDVEDARLSDLGVLEEVPGIAIERGAVSGGPERGMGLHFTCQPAEVSAA